MAQAYLVGSGIAALAAAAFLIRDGGFEGPDIHLFEEGRSIGGSLDAGGTPDTGYTMRGGRMFEPRSPRPGCCAGDHAPPLARPW